jgi:hypothetical protein
MLKHSMSSGALLGEFSNLKSQKSGLKLSEMTEMDQFDAVNASLNPDNNPVEKFRKVGLYKLNSVYPSLERAWFQPLSL